MKKIKYSIETANLLGRPEWANEDEDDICEESLAALVATEDTAPPTATELAVEGWAVVARYYWQAAHASMKSRDFNHMRVMAKQGEAAEHTASPEARLMMGVFGGSMPTPPELAVKRGSAIAQSAAQAAKIAVKAEIARFSGANKKAAQPSAAPKQTTSPQGEVEAEVVKAVLAQNGKITKGDLKKLGFSGVKINAMVLRGSLRIGRGDRVFVYPMA